ncbi:MAG: cation-binding protein, partial [Nocardioides sp.]|nr:cation-binding protein [Nocardioides sp.]
MLGVRGGTPNTRGYRPDMTSLSDQDQTELGGRLSVLTLQKREHVRLDELLHRLVATTGTEQDAVLRDVNRLVFPHAFAEESVLWPIMRRHLPDGEELTLRIEEEHQEVNEIVTALESDPGRADRPQLIDRLVTVLREDVRDEEDELFPRIQQVVDAGALRRYGLAWLAVRRVAPTRPHPVVARRPPGNALAALPLTVLDRSRDRLDGWAQGGHRGAGAAVAASQRLAGVAGRVEQ